MYSQPQAMPRQQMRPQPQGMGQSQGGWGGVNAGAYQMNPQNQAQAYIPGGDPKPRSPLAMGTNMTSEQALNYLNNNKGDWAKAKGQLQGNGGGFQSPFGQGMSKEQTLQSAFKGMTPYQDSEMASGGALTDEATKAATSGGKTSTWDRVGRMAQDGLAGANGGIVGQGQAGGGFQRVSPGLYRSPEGKIVRQSQMQAAERRGVLDMANGAAANGGPLPGNPQVAPRPRAPIKRQQARKVR